MCCHCGKCFCCGCQHEQEAVEQNIGCGCENTVQTQEETCPDSENKQHGCGCWNCGSNCRRDYDYAYDVATSDSVSCSGCMSGLNSNCDDPDVPVYHCGGGCSRSKCRICCDQNGCCRVYPCSWRNSYWPEFAHPRWLCCRDLYNVR